MLSSSDTRLGLQAQTVAMDFQKVFRVTDKTFLGLAGLGTDVQTVSQLYVGFIELLLCDLAADWCFVGDLL